MADQEIWYYSHDGQDRQGPVTWERIQEYFKGGILSPETLIWAPHLPEWTPAQRLIHAKRGMGIPLKVVLISTGVLVGSAVAGAVVVAVKESRRNATTTLNGNMTSQNKNSTTTGLRSKDLLPINLEFGLMPANIPDIREATSAAYFGLSNSDGIKWMERQVEGRMYHLGFGSTGLRRVYVTYPDQESFTDAINALNTKTLFTTLTKTRNGTEKHLEIAAYEADVVVLANSYISRFQNLFTIQYAEKEDPFARRVLDRLQTAKQQGIPNNY